ncbi:MAG: flagellar motor switch protein FliM [Eubacteriales bacterium]|nr:flagellar motor switch protein FliM [Bacillota bacterium]MBV1727752.1 flagellar motor switch protein FliM [Desulforudis sp.]MDZ4042068.1 flagellar motor switch protein FliM [Eubacteriales bacterium]MBU4532814.1 flagellar motor switch protein FliM [Bacillota bacterium]MBU4554142.1 flagellar motor switch protein FliM [Bacillota bacterium]
MKEILSQAEIDHLLSAVSTGQVMAEELLEREHQEKSYKPYDFRRPNKFSKEQLRTLQTLHDNYARILSGFLSGYLRANIVVRVASVDQFTFDDFVRSIPIPTVLTVFTLEPLKGMAVMETNPQFIFPIIDLMFGGPGEMPRKVRDMTDIELSVIRKLTKKLFENLQLAWQDVYSIEPHIEAIETQPRLHQIISPNEIVAVITFTTVVGGTARGLMNICLPHIVLDPMLIHLSSHYRFVHSALQADGTEEKHLSHWLRRVNVDLSLVAGENEISVRDFLNLQVGDVIPLSRRTNQDLDLYVEEQLKFKAQAGVLGRYIGAQITSLVEVGE